MSPSRVEEMRSAGVGRPAAQASHQAQAEVGDDHLGHSAESRCIRGVGYAVLNARVDVSCGAAYAAICCSSRAIVYALASSLWAISSVWPMGPPDVRMWFPSAQTLISIDCQGMLREIVYHSTAYAALCHAVDHMSPSASASSKPILTSMYPVTCWGPR